jgi:hypothetical protein
MHLNPDNPMTDAEIGKVLREYCYLDDPHETCGGLGDLIPLLKVLRYKALHYPEAFKGAEEREEGIIYSSYWLR